MGARDVMVDDALEAAGDGRGMVPDGPSLDVGPAVCGVDPDDMEEAAWADMMYAAGSGGRGHVLVLPSPPGWSDRVDRPLRATVPDDLMVLFGGPGSVVDPAVWADALAAGLRSVLEDGLGVSVESEQCDGGPAVSLYMDLDAGGRGGVSLSLRVDGADGGWLCRWGVGADLLPERGIGPFGGSFRMGGGVDHRPDVDLMLVSVCAASDLGDAMERSREAM